MVSITIPGIAAKIPKTPPEAITEAIPPAVSKIQNEIRIRSSYSAELLFYRENILSGNLHNNSLILILVQ